MQHVRGQGELQHSTLKVQQHQQAKEREFVAVRTQLKKWRYEVPYQEDQCNDDDVGNQPRNSHDSRQPRCSRCISPSEILGLKAPQRLFESERCERADDGNERVEQAQDSEGLLGQGTNEDYVPEKRCYLGKRPVANDIEKGAARLFPAVERHGSVSCRGQPYALAIGGQSKPID